MIPRSVAAVSLAVALLLPAGTGALGPLTLPPPRVTVPTSLGDALENPDFLALQEALASQLDMDPLSSNAWALPIRLLPPPLGMSATAWLRATEGRHATRVIGPGVTETWTGARTVDSDVVVSGDLVIDAATVTFLTPGLGRHTITVTETGSITINNSRIQNDNGDPWDSSYILSHGRMLVDNSEFTEVYPWPVHHKANLLQSEIKNSKFHNILYGILTNRTELSIHHNQVWLANVGIYIDEPVVDEGENSEPSVHNNTVVATDIGILAYYNGAPTVKHNLLRGNGHGIFCISDGVPDPPERFANFSENNAYTNFFTGYSGLRGVSVVTPLGSVNVADSHCIFHDNYLGPSGNGQDSRFLSPKDEETGPVASPNGNSAPALPVDVNEITADTTWDDPGDVGTVDGPFVVNDAHLIAKNFTLDLKGFRMGSKVNGRTTVDNMTLQNGGVALRMSNDIVKGSSLGGNLLYDFIALYRNNATVQKNTITGTGHQNGITMVPAQFVDDVSWSMKAYDNTVRDADNAFVIFEMTTTLERNTVERAASRGVWGQLETLTFKENKIRHAEVGLDFSVGVTVDSTDDTIEFTNWGVSGNTVDTFKFTDLLVSNSEQGIRNALDTTSSVTTSNFTFNSFGVMAILTTPVITTSNFVHNYLQGLIAVEWILAGGQNIPTGITCTSCWGPDDEGRIGNVTYTASATGPNSAPKPGWDGKQKVVDSGTTDLASGALDGPAVSRKGATLRAREVDVDLKGFYIGAKGGGVSGGSTGKLVLENATLRNGAVSANSTDATIRQNQFAGAPHTGISNHYNPVDPECNRFVDSGAAMRVAHRYAGDQVDFRRNLLERSAGVVAGISASNPTRQDVTVRDNGMVDGAGANGLMLRSGNGTIEAHGNNLLGNVVDRGLRDHARNLTPIRPPRFDAGDNFWDDPDGSGPLVQGYNIADFRPYEVVTMTLNGGRGLELFFDERSPKPIYEPFRATANKIAPCTAFHFSPGAPKETDTVTFSDDSFAPSGYGIVKRTWKWGDGSADTITSAASATHKFVDGGSYTVTLTVEDGLGSTATVSRSATVGHVAPTPGFSSSPASPDELMDILFTDTSTHPNSPRDDPPTGWTYSWDFHGEGSSSARNPSFNFADGGSKTVKLTVTDDDGQTASHTKTVSVAHVAPKADYTFSPASPAETDTVQFTDTSTHPNAPVDGITGRGWSCSDGFTSSAQNPSHKFADGGSYTCTLEASDNDGMKDSVAKTIAVGHVAPIAAFGAGPGSELDSIGFSDTSTHPNAADAPPAGWTYLWSFGDGATSSARNPSHDFADGGSKTVTLTVTDNDGQSSSASKTTTVSHVAPIAGFGFTPANPDIGETVAFAETSSHPNAPVDAIVSYSWSFGDGATSAERNPSHAFSAQGLYDVTLTVTDDDGLTASATIRVPVGNIPPVAAFTFSPPDPTDLDTLQFDSSGSSDPDGSIAGYAWDFGDGSTSTAQHPTHQFADDGFYTVSLTVTDNLGASTTVAQVVEVLNVAPTAGFTQSPIEAAVGDEVQFSSTSGDPDGSIVGYAWDLGDGTTSTAQNPTHTYVNGGDYTVTLTVTDDDGATDTHSVTIHVCETGITIGPGLKVRVELCPRLQL